MTHIKTALLSVSDKTNLVPFARALAERGVNLLSTGGTAVALREAGLAVRDVSEHTGMEEMMDGRVKTLHPKVHGGLLARRDHAEDQEAMARHGITPIDLVVINLYPFVQTVANGADADTCIENIDIGGPAMVRSSAKNHAYVTIVTSPEDYDTIITQMDVGGGDVGLPLRRNLAAKAFAHTAAYDAHISGWFAAQAGDSFPASTTLPLTRAYPLRYGENPHQRAAFYLTSPSQAGTLATAEQLHGKELSYNNLNDTDAAWNLVCELPQPAIAIIKHANPCGVATADSLTRAYARALACDPQSAFGGIIASNMVMDADTAAQVAALFAEVVIAPAFTPDALALLQTKKNLRVLHTHGALLPKTLNTPHLRSVSGGILMQQQDELLLPLPLGEGWGEGNLDIVSATHPTETQLQDMLFAFTVAKHVKSNAIVLAREGAAIGIGAGQMSRIDSVRIACQKAEAAGLATHGCVLASDAFFPFDDNVHHAAHAGIAAIIQPGGSVRDGEVIAAANQHGMALCFTGMRHFRH